MQSKDRDTDSDKSKDKKKAKRKPKRNNAHLIPKERLVTQAKNLEKQLLNSSLKPQKEIIKRKASQNRVGRR